MSLIGVRAKNHPQQTSKLQASLFGPTRVAGQDNAANTRTTPEVVWRAVLKEFGPFTLDVAASAGNTRCSRWYDITDDGLSKPWSGRVWANPPYGNVGKWVEKATAEAPNCEVIVMLVPANRTEQRWWHLYVEPTRDRPGSVLKTRFLPGRLEFGPPALDGKGNRPPFGCALLIWEGA